MLYLALPPAPPPIVATIAPEQAAGKPPSVKVSAVNQPTKNSTSDSGNASTATTQSLECQLSEFKSQSQKQNLANNLLARMLATSTSVKTQGVACDSQKQKLPSQQQKSVSNISVTSQDTALSPEDANSPQIASNLASNKSAEKNTIGTILAAVQQLIHISLYTSINDTITDSLQLESSTSNPIAGKAQTDITSNNNLSVANNEISKVNNPNNNQVKQNIEKNTNIQTVANNPRFDATKILTLVQELISISISASLNNKIIDTTSANSNPQEAQKIASNPKQDTPPNLTNSLSNSQTVDNSKVAAAGNIIDRLKPNSDHKITPGDSIPNSNPENSLQLAKSPDEPFLVELSVNGREIGTLDVILENKILLIPLDSFARLTGLTVEIIDGKTQVKTPLGTVQISPDSLKKINGVSYISSAEMRDKLNITIDLNIADLTLLADLPWRSQTGQYRPSQPNLKPDVFAPQNGLSNLRQELNWTSGGGDSSLRSSTRLGGRLLGGSVGIRFDNNFVNSPDVSEYYFYKRNGNFRYQIGRQQLGLHPLLNGVDLTGLQFGYSNLPPESFGTTFNATELLPRRSRPIQTFRGEAPPASFVQLRIGGVIIAQQQVGFNGIYEFVDVNLPVGQTNEIELLIFDRTNLRVPSEIRTVRINASDLLLPSGGNVQLAGLGISGNLVQDQLFGEFNSDYNGKLMGFYQFRQGLSNNLTFEGSLQAIPDTLQSQAGLVWRLANPVVLSASVGSSYDQIGYTADLDIQLDKLDINANSQSLPRGYRSGKRDSFERFNHSLELKYRFNNKFNLGFIARNRQDDTSTASYILPTFTLRPFSTVSLNGRPDIDGRYLFNAFYQPNWATRFSFNTYGDAYLSDLSYKFKNNYQVSAGTEFGAGSAPRYTLGFGYFPNNLRQLSWNLGLALRDSEVAPLASASMQVLPGLLARVEYQGIPSRATSGNFGGFGNDRLSLTLVSDLSFARGQIAPASYTGITKERGAIAGRIKVEGAKGNFDLSGSNVRIINKKGEVLGSARTDLKGNFFVGGLPEGNYIVELEPDELPIELSVPKTSMVAEVSSSAVTRLDFPVRAEFGVAGRVTDVTGQPMAEVKVELINSSGARILSGITDRFGLYRLDGVPVGQYMLRVSNQDILNRNDSLPKRQIEIRNEFVYNQNLQLPVSAAAKRNN
ncbi:carboxypeptidase regulatory-like domain-containing protein [Calothrix sp. UHCC 0171]|uniref:carboxypeptidase regulatory-like domain-containing protein n=1 Tax=Calothrix sp. UHCC 0171 TaxID=3110245 RepID=UPI002B1FF6F7|nr:carboxypeptidase regulatory-like domain-containing protein [Calothrix sp. UHCC 0171]MEA5572760.1 carboxypeptidase regulatory-like domain-containing protein [Calothrix sp. UHCC 0171]